MIEREWLVIYHWSRVLNIKCELTGLLMLCASVLYYQTEVCTCMSTTYLCLARAQAARASLVKLSRAEASSVASRRQRGCLEEDVVWIYRHLWPLWQDEIGCVGVKTPHGQPSRQGALVTSTLLKNSKRASLLRGLLIACLLKSCGSSECE